MGFRWANMGMGFLWAAHVGTTWDLDGLSGLM